MTAVYLCLAAGFFVPAGSIVLDMRRDELDLPPLGYGRRRVASEIERLTAPLPPARPLDPADWPQPVSPLDLPSLGDTEALADTVLSSRVFEPAPAPAVLGLPAGVGRHHVGVAPGTDDQRARWNTPTGQFWQIVEALSDLSEPCSHCGAPEDGEPAHAGCPGCSCPCSLEVAA